MTQRLGDRPSFSWQLAIGNFAASESFAALLLAAGRISHN